MSRNQLVARIALRPTATVAVALLGVALAVGAGLLLAQVLMAPPRGDLLDLALYLSIAALATTSLGWAAIQLAERAVRLSIPVKAFLSATIGGAVALLNVLIVAQFMFLSTSHDLKLLVALIVFSATVTTVFNLTVASTVARRLETVAGGIRSLAAGRYDVQLEPAGADEVANLAQDVNRLAARLREAEEQRDALDRERRELTAAISHDLRTPLASVRAMVEALEDGVVDEPEGKERYYRTMRREIERLTHMINDLFDLAQLDAGALKLKREPVALQEIVAEVVDAMQPQAQLSGVSLRFAIDGDLPQLSLDGARMERVAANLVRNALEHTPSGGRVDVSVAAQDGWVTLRVADTGEGIASADLVRIWDRFYRAEKSRKRAPEGDGGAGLGLAIVKGIVEAHGGTVEGRSSLGRGATFIARLPRGEDA